MQTNTKQGIGDNSQGDYYEPKESFQNTNFFKIQIFSKYFKVDVDSNSAFACFIPTEGALKLIYAMTSSIGLSPFHWIAIIHSIDK